MASAAGGLTAAQRRAYEKLPVPLCVLGAAGDEYRLLVVSDGMCALLGRDRGTITGPGDALLKLIAPAAAPEAGKAPRQGRAFRDLFRELRTLLADNAPAAPDA